MRNLVAPSALLNFGTRLVSFLFGMLPIFGLELAGFRPRFGNSLASFGVGHVAAEWQPMADYGPLKLLYTALHDLICSYSNLSWTGPGDLNHTLTARLGRGGLCLVSNA